MTLRRWSAVLLALTSISAAAALVAQSPPPSRDYPIRPVPFTDVRFDAGFWASKLEVNRAVTIPTIMRQNEKTGRIANFARASGRATGDYEGRRFNDTDVYKVLEAASYSLKTHPDPALEHQVDEIVGLIAAAQEPDGYLYPARTVKSSKPVAGIGAERWVNLNGSHELYNVGHMYEAALAHYQATGRDAFFTVARRNAELVMKTFGSGRRLAVPGHQEIELALVRLFRATGDRRYFDMAKFFLDQRGHEHVTEPYAADSNFAIYNGRPYMQDHEPVTSQKRAVGHAVRATYMYSAMTDVAALAGDPAYRAAVTRLWDDVVGKRLYLTGGIGARGTVEAFGDDYELPNRQAYTETCASIGNHQWNHRMFLMTGEGRYIDVMERVLYNGLLSGVSLAGDRFFYQNPLESRGNVERSEYFDVACCPANVARTLAQLPGFAYASRGDSVYVNLFASGEARVTIAGGAVRIAQHTRYPWDGVVSMTIRPDRPATFTLLVRIPGWASNVAVPGDLYRFAAPDEAQPTLRVNGRPTALVLEKGYASIPRAWAPGDVVELSLPMTPRRVLSHDDVVGNRGLAAIERGPLVYAVEAADNGGRALDLSLPLDARLTAAFRPALLGGVTVVTGTGSRNGSGPGGASQAQVTAVPYYAWANRGKGEMTVWIPVEEKR